MTDIKLIALDMDGTTLRKDKSLTKRTLDVVQKVIDKGILVVPATGRLVEGIKDTILKAKPIKYIISANGAQIIDYVNKSVLYENTIPCSLAASVLKRLSNFDVHTYVHCNNKHLRSLDLNHRFSDKFPFIKFNQDNAYVNLAEEVKKGGTDIQKIGILTYDQTVKRLLLESAGSFPDVCMTEVGPYNVEINALTASKGTALKYLCDKLNVSSSQTLSIGDSQNDFSMLKFTGYSVAMGNAIDEVKSIADEVTCENDKDGVAVFLEKFLHSSCSL